MDLQSQSKPPISNARRAENIFAVLWPVGLVAALFVVQVGLLYAEVTLVLGAPILLSVPLLAGLFLYHATKNFRGRRRGAAAVRIAAVPLLVLALGFPLLGGGHARVISHHIRIAINDDPYMATIRATAPDANGFRYLEFDLGGFMLNPVKLIYDESDELDMPAENRSAAWWKKVQGSELAVCRYQVTKVKTHFYAVDFSC
jgi:hypothetical protein